MATNFDIDLDNNQDNFDIDLNDQVESFVVDFGEITWVTNDDFNKLKNRPSYAGELMTGDTNIPAVENAILTIQKNGTDIGTFTANQSEDTNINITVPTATSELTNDANFQNANDLSTAISNHNQSTSAHQDIRQAITDEATARFNADNGLQGQIDAITSASDVVDIVGTYAELQAYDTQHLKDNDVVKVLQDETHNDAMTYWRWSTHTDTWTYIGAEGPYYTKSETNTLLDEKLDADEVPDGFFDGPATISPTEGTNIEIEGGLKLKSVNLKGDTTQQTYSGKNLLQFTNLNVVLSNSAQQGATITIGDNSIHFVATGTNSTQYAYYYTQELDATKQYTISGVAKKILKTSALRINFSYSDDGSTWGTNYYILTGDASAGTIENFVHTFTGHKFYRFGFYNSFNATEIGTETEYYNIQIEEGSTPTSYEPYVGGTASPNPGYPQNVNVVTGTQTIKATGKNLWDFTGINPTSSANFTSTFQDGELLVNWTGGFDLYPTNGTSDSVALDNTQTYTLSAKVKGSPLIFKVRGGSEIFRTTTTTEYTQFSGSFTGVSSLRIDIIRLQSASGSASIKELQLEVGSTATDYQPFAGMATYTIDLGATELCKIGTYQDYIYKSGDDWYVHKEVGKSELGSLTWTAAAGSQSTHYRMESTGLGTIIGSGDSYSIFPAFCTHFTPILAGANNQGTYYYQEGISATNTGSKIHIYDEDYNTSSSASSFKTWLTNNNVILYYVLATPTDTKITNNTLIGQLNALLNATLYQPLTYMSSSGNLPAIIKVEAYTEHLNSLLEIAAEPTPTPVTPTIASGAPTTSTTGNWGEIYIDSDTDTAYMCVDISGSTYTWKQITA